MIPSLILSTARLVSGTGTDVVSDVNAYTFLNTVISDFWKDITDGCRGYGLATWNINTVAGTKEYAMQLPVAGTDTFGVLRAEEIGIKYETQDYYTKAQILTYETKYDPSYYENKQQEGSPFVVLNDKSIILYPEPNASFTNGIQIIGPQKHFPLSTSTTDTEASLLISNEHHDVLVYGLRYWFYMSRGSDFMGAASSARAEYQQLKGEAVSQMMNRYQDPIEGIDTDLSNYE